MSYICYLLDPETTLFKAVALPNGISFKPFYDLLGCRLIEPVRFDERHSLFVDEEGLCAEGLTAFTVFDGYPQPLADQRLVSPSAARPARGATGADIEPPYS